MKPAPNPSPLQGFDAQAVPFLSSITQLEGATYAALQFVPTTGITVPYYVAIDIGNGADVWILKAGTDATDTENGILRPGDYAASNQKVWSKQA